jgi:pilus assembly protein CpaB
MAQQTGGRGRAVLFLGGSLLVAFLTAILVFQLLKSSRDELREAQKPPETLDVVVAIRDLYVGLPITEEDIIVRQLTPEMLPGELVFDRVDDVINRVPRERVLANEPLRAERLAEKDAGVGLNAIIATNRRAMTVETDTESGLAGMLQPGNYVDIIVTIRPDDANIDAKWVTETILQGIRVLAVGSSLTGKSSSEDSKSGKKSTSSRRTRPSVTLEVTLPEAEKLALASSKGDIHLVLRNDVDMHQLATHGPITSASVIGYETAPAVASNRSTVGSSNRGASKTDEEATTVEIIGDGGTQVDRFDEDGNRVDEKTKRSRSRNR